MRAYETEYMGREEENPVVDQDDKAADSLGGDPVLQNLLKKYEIREARTDDFDKKYGLDRKEGRGTGERRDNYEKNKSEIDRILEKYAKKNQRETKPSKPFKLGDKDQLYDSEKDESEKYDDYDEENYDDSQQENSKAGTFDKSQKKDEKPGKNSYTRFKNEHKKDDKFAELDRKYGSFGKDYSKLSRNADKNEEEEEDEFLKKIMSAEEHEDEPDDFDMFRRKRSAEEEDPFLVEFERSRQKRQQELLSLRQPREPRAKNNYENQFKKSMEKNDDDHDYLFEDDGVNEEKQKYMRFLMDSDTTDKDGKVQPDQNQNAKLESNSKTEAAGQLSNSAANADNENDDGGENDELFRPVENSNDTSNKNKEKDENDQSDDLIH